MYVASGSGLCDAKTGSYLLRLEAKRSVVLPQTEAFPFSNGKMAFPQVWLLLV